MLTKKQKKVLDFVEGYKNKKSYSPSLDEIKNNFKLSSVSTAHHYIKKLRDAGYLTKEDNQPRAIDICMEPLIQIDLVGNITAGQPIEAIETGREQISIPSIGINKNDIHYALKVQGDSMVEEGILDGDIVVIKKQESADNGQTVVAIIDDNEATLKKIYREENQFRLQPANQSMLPFFRKEVEVRGVVIKVIRDFVKS